MSKLFNSTIFHLLLIGLIGIIIYSNTFNVPFHWDDTPNIVANYKLKDLSNFWPPSESRWFGYLTFVLNYYFGGLNVAGYHIVNLIIHIFNAILVYWLVVFTCKTPYFKVSVISVSEQTQKTDTVHYSPIHPFSSASGGQAYLPLFIALIFVSHPIQTQAVTYIVQRFTSLAAFFYLLSLVTYIKSRLSIPHATRYTLYAVSLFSAILAMKTKEIAFTLPFVILLYEFSFVSKPPSKIAELKKLLPLAGILLTLLIIPLSLIGLDKPLGDAIGELRETSQESEEIPRWSYLITQFRVIVTYLRLFFIPANQNLDYDYPLYHSLFNPQVFLSFLFLLIILALGIYLLYAKRHTLSASRFLSFGIFWFFITLSVESSIIPIRDVIFEHRLYLPVIGIIIVFVSAAFYILQAMIQNPKRSLAACCLLLATAVIVLSIAAYQRNAVWHDEIKLWEDAARKSSGKVRTHFNLGAVYYKQGLLNEAVLEYKTALRLDPRYSALLHNNLGNAYYSQGRAYEAIQAYKDALRLNPGLAEPHYNIGNIYMSEGRLNEAVQEYKEALRLNPGYAEIHNGLGFAYYEQGKLAEAAQEFLTVIQLDSYNPEAHNSVGNVYMKLGRLDQAIAHYQAALRLEPNHAITRYNLGLAYRQKGLINEAAHEFQEALRISPDLVQARQSLEALQR
ncbi:MAG: tetratricopeptide repeat protein [Nitrospirae bacterium]|nr:MAG: tetratricopeptide repeat protein [Nitrospirota bacterium]